MRLTRDEAWQLLNEYNKSEALIKHGLTVEGVMRHFAVLYGEDAEKWGIIGLIHDLDYEMYPEEHLRHTEELLKPYGVSDAEIHAINSHGWGICSDVEPAEHMEKVLFAVDELTGLIVACALVTPDKKLAAVTTESVLKKWKKKDFARGANREIISKGAEMLGMPLEELVSETLKGMQKIAGEIGL